MSCQSRPVKIYKEPVKLLSSGPEGQWWKNVVLDPECPIACVD